jgi:rhodanese-related sulfurtransferase
MHSKVLATEAANSSDTISHFSKRLSLETDCSDVHEDLSAGIHGFVVLDVRGPISYAKGHVPGAYNMPHRNITSESLEAWASATLFIVYCAGPHCNGADKAALRIATLGRPVKMMIGGITGWIDEGFSLVSGSEPGSLRLAKVS